MSGDVVAVGGGSSPTATDPVFAVSRCSPQPLLSIDFSIDFTTQKQSTEEFCEVLKIGSSTILPASTEEGSYLESHRLRSCEQDCW